MRARLNSFEDKKEFFEMVGDLHVLPWRDPKEVFSHYKRIVKHLCESRRKLKNPINSKTGKPLKSITLKSYASHEKSLRRYIKEYKKDIQRMILGGHIGQKTRIRWLRETVKTSDYANDLSEHEKKFVEVFAGNAILAAREAGYKGNYVEIKRIGLENMKNPKIQNAFQRKRYCKMANCGMFLLPGCGQGDGKPFRVKEHKTTKTGLIYLLSYLEDIKKRLKERVDVIITHDINPGAELYSAVLNLNTEVNSDDYLRAREKIQDAEKRLNIIYRGGLYKGY